MTLPSLLRRRSGGNNTTRTTSVSALFRHESLSRTRSQNNLHVWPGPAAGPPPPATNPPKLLCYGGLGIGFSCVTAVLFPLGCSEAHPPFFEPLTKHRFPATVDDKPNRPETLFGPGTFIDAYRAPPPRITRENYEIIYNRLLYIIGLIR